MRPALAIAFAYLLGSIPFGYLIVRSTQGADIRDTGSGGTGATNVSRRAGKTAGVLTLVLDALKGAAAVLAAKFILSETSLDFNGVSHPVQQVIYWWIAAASVAVILGHMYPVWLRFRGGKGVATAIGVFLVLVPMAVALAAVLFVLIVWRTRYVSLGSIFAAVAIPVFVLVQSRFMHTSDRITPILATSVIGAALILFAHRQNITRLLAGTESKFR